MIRLVRIGTVSSGFKKQEDPFEMRKHESTIEVDPEYLDGLYRLDESRYIQVIFGFHLSGDYSLKGPVYNGEIKGVFASRSPRRPSGLGLSTVRLLKLENNILRVRGLDAVDGTPVYDIKPFTPVFDYEEVEKVNQDWISDNPRNDIIRMSKGGELSSCLAKAGELHGHFCPGLALGVYAAVRGMRELANWSSDGIAENFIVITETNNCFADGIQVVSGCTFGNNTLIFHDLGKTAATFAVRGGKGFRIAVKPGYWNLVNTDHPDFQSLFDKVITHRQGGETGLNEFKKLSREVSFHVLEYPFEKVFSCQEVKPTLPACAPIFESVPCEKCGEGVMQSRAVEKNGKTLCYVCAGKDFPRLNGAGIICVPRV
ncbi:MAG: tRNA (N6-threonylcarbamoyladenosine(37)-N6)-methyltransferase TrmO [Spirochaetales bacterium]|nr:tRNA (N6-threonylcarbamoyladenosine(37)-N6)-methyltransferase TrmO [Spirochaetales bacterium]